METTTRKIEDIESIGAILRDMVFETLRQKAKLELNAFMCV
jgi:hypothetical protein